MAINVGESCFLPDIFVHLKIPEMSEREILLARQIEILQHGLEEARSALVKIAFNMEHRAYDFPYCSKDWANDCREAATRADSLAEIPLPKIINITNPDLCRPFNHQNTASDFSKEGTRSWNKKKPLYEFFTTLGQV